MGSGGELSWQIMERGGADMSDLAKTIDRLEQWVEYWQPHQPPEFIADLRRLAREDWQV